MKNIFFAVCFLFLVCSCVRQKQVEFTIDSYGTIIEYKGEEKSLVIPSQIEGKNVSSVANGVFRDKGLESVTIPESVTLIGYHAFADNSLTEITIGQDVLLGLDADLEFHFVFDETFDNFYNLSGMKAGTYVLKDGQWSILE
ncbi:MAG: leucine-rich repeat domain-containing protein [Treponema sp.]|nr:leucine-rich repeat domain-containing protein [Treponema sp.]MCL2236753.1 leucine-rich repeat domain-containing protein [Treponema sp.]